MTKHLRKANGEFNGSIGDGKTKTPKPEFKLKHKVASPKQLEIDKIEEVYYLATEIPQRQYKQSLALAKATLRKEMSPKSRKLFDKYRFIRDFDEIKGVKGFVNIPSVSKAEYNLTKAKAELKLLSVLAPAMLSKEKALILVAQKYPKKHWW